MEELQVTVRHTTFEVRHRTTYQYQGPVTLSPQVIRMTPRHHRHDQSLEVSPTGNIRLSVDAYENPSRIYEKIGPLTEFEITNRLLVYAGNRNPFDFLLEPRGSSVPAAYDDRETAALAPFRTLPPPLPAEALDLYPEDRETVPFLVSLNQAVHNAFSYSSRDTPGILTPEELFRDGAGSCRDFASLLLLLLRAKGCAARFTSGYLLETGDLKGADAMHAWVEIYLPGAGWIGLDPTNGVLCDESFVPCAVAIHSEETTPVEGRYYADGPVASEMDASLKIRKIEPESQQRQVRS